jgi:hypothetical protein
VRQAAIADPAIQQEVLGILGGRLTYGTNGAKCFDPGFSTFDPRPSGLSYQRDFERKTADAFGRAPWPPISFASLGTLGPVFG